jgi:hypothetical protein
MGRQVSKYVFVVVAFMLAYYKIYDWIITIVIKCHEIILMWKDINVWTWN